MKGSLEVTHDIPLLPRFYLTHCILKVTRGKIPFSLLNLYLYLLFVICPPNCMLVFAVGVLQQLRGKNKNKNKEVEGARHHFSCDAADTEE